MGSGSMTSKSKLSEDFGNIFLWYICRYSSIGEHCSTVDRRIEEYPSQTILFEVVRQTGPTKAIGPAIFYDHFCTEVAFMVQTFFHSGSLFKVLNNSFITCIFKTSLAFNCSLLHVIFDFLIDKKKGKGTLFLGHLNLDMSTKEMGRNFP